jgi:hypothetical protein
MRCLLQISSSSLEDNLLYSVDCSEEPALFFCKSLSFPFIGLKGEAYGMAREYSSGKIPA